MSKDRFRAHNISASEMSGFCNAVWQLQLSHCYCRMVIVCIFRAPSPIHTLHPKCYKQRRCDNFITVAFDQQTILIWLQKCLHKYFCCICDILHFRLLGTNIARMFVVLYTLLTLILLSTDKTIWCLNDFILDLNCQCFINKRLLCSLWPLA